MTNAELAYLMDAEDINTFLTILEINAAKNNDLVIIYAHNNKIKLAGAMTGEFDSVEGIADLYFIKHRDSTEIISTPNIYISVGTHMENKKYCFLKDFSEDANHFPAKMEKIKYARGFSKISVRYDDHNEIYYLNTDLPHAKFRLFAYNEYFFVNQLTSVGVVINKNHLFSF